jgi:hypothetical protein
VGVAQEFDPMAPLVSFYVCDLLSSSELLKLLFADAMSITDSDSHLNTVFSYGNAEFKRLVYFFRAHKLAFHPNKTKLLFFRQRNSVPNLDQDKYLH